MALSPGTRIGSYEVVALIGVGSMGEVYEARDVRLDRKVALKILSVRSEWGADVGQLFLRESSATARLSSPNIVYAFDHGVDAQGRYYQVREFIDGESLAMVLSRGALSEPDAVTVAASVCNALVAAHAQHLIHRDIKPSNVLIPKGDRYDQAKLSDFGLVGLLRNQTGSTRQGEIFGTPYYMSPEQLRGESQSAATDLYGLGVLLYEMLYGRTPFRGDLSQLIVQVLNQEVSFPADPPTSQRVRELIAQLIAKRVTDRPGSAADVLSRLRSLIPQTREEVASSLDLTILAQRPVSSAALSAPVAAVLRSWPRLVLWPVALFAVLAAVLGSVALVSIIRGSQLGIPIPNMAGVLFGAAIGAGGVVLSVSLSRSLKRLRPALADEASRVLLGAERRESLTASLALDVDRLVSRCRELDQRILGRTLVIVVDKLQHAKDSGDQLALLPMVVSITTQLSERLLPWYVRYQKILAFFVALLGLVTGLVTAIQALP